MGKGYNLMNNLKKVNAKELYNLLIEKKVIGATGKIIFEMADIPVQISTTDTVGQSIQSWLKQWMIHHEIYFTEPESTQVFPDFILDDDDMKNNLLEVKAFNYDASPAFDIANFESYCTSLSTKAYRLDADYLIFGYSMNNGLITIKDIWLKKIWEISSTSSNHALRVQDKRGTIYNIRPCKWYGTTRRNTISPFTCKEEFLLATYKTLKNYKNTSINCDTWIQSVIDNYKLHTSIDLSVDLSEEI